MSNSFFWFENLTDKISNFLISLIFGKKNSGKIFGIIS